jgi:hypothetical protein
MTARERNRNDLEISGPAHRSPREALHNFQRASAVAQRLKSEGKYPPRGVNRNLLARLVLGMYRDMIRETEVEPHLTETRFNADLRLVKNRRGRGMAATWQVVPNFFSPLPSTENLDSHLKLIARSWSDALDSEIVPNTRRQNVYPRLMQSAAARGTPEQVEKVDGLVRDIRLMRKLSEVRAKSWGRMRKT